MILPIDKLFILLGVVSLPNLYHKADYNIPLMIFCFLTWNLPYRSIITYLLIISWVVDLIRLLLTLSKDPDSDNKDPTLVLIT